MAEQHYPSARSLSTTPPTRRIFHRRLALVRSETRAAAREYIRDRVRINAVGPGATATAMSLRPGETDDDARLRESVPLGDIGALEIA